MTINKIPTSLKILSYFSFHLTSKKEMKLLFTTYYYMPASKELRVNLLDMMQNVTQKICRLTGTTVLTLFMDGQLEAR